MRSYLFLILMTALLAVGLPVALPGTVEAATLEVTTNTAVGSAAAEQISTSIDTTCNSMLVCALKTNVSLTYLRYSSTTVTGLGAGSGAIIYGNPSSGPTCYKFDPLPEGKNGGAALWNGRYVWAQSAANNDDAQISCLSN